MKQTAVGGMKRQASYYGCRTGGEQEPCLPQPRGSLSPTAPPALHRPLHTGRHRGSGAHSAGVGKSVVVWTEGGCAAEPPTQAVRTRESRGPVHRDRGGSVPLLLSLLLPLLLLLLGGCEAGSPQAECTAQQHCGPTQCCRLSGFRFSIPECSPRGVEGDWCRPRPDPHYRTSLIYPGGVELEVDEVYHVLCPCAPGFTCEDRSATCIPQQRDEGGQQQHYYDEGAYSPPSLQERVLNGRRPPVFYY